MSLMKNEAVIVDRWGLENGGHALQIKGCWESNITFWFRFLYSQKRNCTSSLFPKQNYNALFPTFHIYVSVSDLYIYSNDGSVLETTACSFFFWEYINRNQTFILDSHQPLICSSCPPSANSHLSTITASCLHEQHRLIMNNHTSPWGARPLHE